MKQRLHHLSCLSLLALAASARAEGEWLRHFRIGASVGMNLSADFQTTGVQSVSGSNPGAAVGGIDHFYDDGYVRVDETGNALNRTTFWGYQDASQRDDAAKTITYRGTRSFTANGFTSADDSPNLGFDMAYGGTFRNWDRVAIGGEFGFNFTLFSTHDRSVLSGTLVRSVHSYTHDFPTADIPAPPYNGNSSGVGPSLPATPTALPDETVAGTVGGAGRSLEGILYNFRLGPLLRWQMHPRWTLNGSAGGAFGFFDGVYRYNETIALATGATTRNVGKFGSLEMTYGGYAGAVVMYDSGNYWEAFVGAHFMHLNSVDLEGPGRRATLNLDAGIFLTAGINWSF